MLNKHLPEPSSEAGAKDLGFAKLAFLSWKEKQTSFVTPLKNVLFLVDSS